MSSVDEFDNVIYEFERSWQEAASPPDVALILSDDVPIALRTEVAHIDLEYRVKGGHDCNVERYLPADWSGVAEYQRLYEGLIAAHDRLQSQCDMASPNGLRDQPQQSDGVSVTCPECRAAVVVDAVQAKCTSCGVTFAVEQTPTNNDQQHPKTLGRFELAEVVGRGSFGTVYRARDTELDRIVAVKMPRAAFTGDEDRERFVREARSVAQLNHAGIVAIHEVVQNDEQPCIVSEFVDGQTLAEALAQVRFPFGEVAVLCHDLALALDHAHGRGVVHRDLKPSNIMLDPIGNHGGSESGSDIGASGRSGRSGKVQRKFQPRIMDFGLARRDQGDITVTMEGQILGTPAYMSPEQAKGQVRDVDGRTDIYSLGVIMFEMLTGEIPFRGSMRMVIEQAISSDAPEPRKLTSHVPLDLNTICLKCLEKDPGRRYSSAALLADDLERYLTGVPVHARPIGRLTRFGRWCRRHRLETALLLLVAAIAVVAPVVAAVQSSLRSQAEIAEGKEKQARELAEEAEHQQSLARKAAEVAKAETQQQLYNADLRLAQIAVANNSVDEAMRMLLKHVPVDDAAKDYRGFIWRYLFNRCSAGEVVAKPGIGRLLHENDGSETIRWLSWFNGNMITYDLKSWKTVDRHQVNAGGLLRFSNGEDAIAVGMNRRTVSLWHCRGRDIQPDNKIPIDENISSADISPDGTTVVMGTGSRDRKNNRLVVWDTAEQKVRYEFKTKRQADDIRFSPDGQWVLVAALAGLEIRETETFEIVKTLGENPPYAFARWSANQKQIAATDWSRSTADFYDVATGQLSGKAVGHTAPMIDMVFAENDKVLLTAGSDGTARRWDTATSQLLDTFIGHAGWVESVVEIPGGVLTSGRDTTIRKWMDADRAVVNVPLGIKGTAVGAAVFSPDGSQLLMGESKFLYLRNCRTGKINQTLEIPGGRHANFTSAIASDHAVVFAGTTGGDIWKWQLDSGHGELFVPLPEKVTSDLSPSIGDLSYSRDAGWIAVPRTLSNKVDIHNAETAEVLQSFQFSEIPTSLDLSDDGKWLAVSAGPIVSVIDCETWKQHCELKVDGSRSVSVAVSHDSKLIAAAGLDGVIRVWDLRQPGKPQLVRGPSIAFTDITFSPDDRLLCGQSLERKLRLWDTGRWELKATLSTDSGNSNSRFGLEFSPDGRRLAALVDQNTVRIWTAADTQLIERELRRRGK